MENQTTDWLYDFVNEFKVRGSDLVVNAPGIDGCYRSFIEDVSYFLVKNMCDKATFEEYRTIQSLIISRLQKLREDTTDIYIAKVLDVEGLLSGEGGE